MSVEQERHAAQLLARARRGELGQDGIDMVALFEAAVSKGQRAEDRADEAEHAMFGLAAACAELLDGEDLTETVNKLPRRARRTILAYRHKGIPMLLGFKPSDQHGPLPAVPPKHKVWRDWIRTVDADAYEPPDELDAAERLAIEAPTRRERRV